MSTISKLFRLLTGFALFAVLTGLTGWITLMIMTSGGDVVIPDVTGKDLKDSLATLQSRQLYLVLDGEEFHSEAPRGVIIGQNPLPGETRKSFSIVRVILSAGPERLEMPDYRGFGLRQARNEISNMSTTTIRENYLYHNDFADGEVIAHVPGPGEVIIPGANITLLVSKGKKQKILRMPDLIGLTIKESRGLLQEFQSQLDIVISDRREFGPGIVIGQSPESGNPLTLKDRIDLTVTADEQKAPGTPSLFTWKSPAGFLAKSLVITYTVEGKTEILMEREVKPSEEVFLYVPNTGKGVMEISLDGHVVFSEVR